ncbi:unnamed protein product [Orchesella dallaii]|uniref:Innexin n=1 Tax=Orchesella dallaii TaxID=48710 RepID=A0ABP1RD75_9HEXA
MSIFSALVNTLIGKQSEVNIDTSILKLHYRVSFRIFVLGSLLLTTKDLTGDAITCYGDKLDKDETLNAYCWIQSTYSVTEYFHDCNAKKDCTYPGVGQLLDHFTSKFHRYYQWTSVTLFFQGLLCYAPRFLWKIMENGLQNTLAYDRKLRYYPITSSDDDEGPKQHLQRLAIYFKTHRGQHQFYFLKYCCCEVLGLLAVVANIFIIDALLGYQFLDYGANVLGYWWRSWSKANWWWWSKANCDCDEDDDNSYEMNPMIEIFPLLAKCSPLKTYGPSGNIITPDPVCVLPLNNLNDKIYLFLWFYLFFELSVSALGLLYRVLMIFLTNVRVILLKVRCLGVKNKVVEDLCRRTYIGDWFVIYIMSKNFFGSPIHCIYDEMLEEQKSFVDDYCWKYHQPMVPQISPISPRHAAINKDLQVFSGNQLTYYQWLPLLFIFQALLTYIPSWLWNNLKDNRIQETVSNLKDPLKPASRRKLLIINLANDLFTQVIQKRYAKPFIICESLNVLCLILNVVLTDFFFHNRFIMYGIKEIWMRFSRFSFRSEDSELFPQFGKCSIKFVKNQKFEMTKDAVCMITFNSLCENIYMFLWSWCVVLILAIIIGLTYRLYGMFSRRKRRKLLLEAADKSCDEKLQKICEKLSFYSWFTLYRISRNVDPLTFQDIISSLVGRMEGMSLFKTVKSRSRTMDHQSVDEIHDISTVV